MKHGFFRELKRRHVYRVAAAYAVVGWLVIQMAATIGPMLHLPDAVGTTILVLVMLGFPVALVMAWAYELTPDGVRRTEAPDSPHARAPEQTRIAGHTLDRIILGVLVVAVAFMGWRMWAQPRPTSMVLPPASLAAPSTSTATSALAPIELTVSAQSIAVLPFENLSPDKDNAYFANGVQDLILTKLADIGALKVISRASTMQYGSHPRDLKKIGRELGVATLLEGSVQRVGNQVLINVQLIDANTDSHLWADSYRRTLKDVFGVEGEVAGKIATALKARLSREEARRLATALSDDPRANDLYLQAEEWMSGGVTHGMTLITLWKRAIPLYRQAVARDPGFALARAHLSFYESNFASAGGGGENVEAMFDDARLNAERAVKLAPELADSYRAIAAYDMHGRADYDAALKAITTGIRLRPNFADMYRQRGKLLYLQGQYDEALGAMKQAVALDPRSFLPVFFLGQAYMAVGDYERAEKWLQQAIALKPENMYPKGYYARSILYRTGDVNRAMAVIDEAQAPFNLNKIFLLPYQRRFDVAIDLLKRIPDSFFKETGWDRDYLLGDQYRWSGDSVRARAHYAKALPQLRARLTSAVRPDTLANDWLNVADAQLGMGETDKGIASIETALAMLPKVKSHPSQTDIMVTSAMYYAEAGRADESVALIRRALARPGIGVSYAPVMLWIDPAWDPIRDTPAFRALLGKYASQRPPAVPAKA